MGPEQRPTSPAGTSADAGTSHGDEILRPRVVDVAGPRSVDSGGGMEPGPDHHLDPAAPQAVPQRRERETAGGGPSLVRHDHGDGLVDLPGGRGHRRPVELARVLP